MFFPEIISSLSCLSLYRYVSLLINLIFSYLEYKSLKMLLFDKITIPIGDEITYHIEDYDIIIHKK
jgi:hypothetical protein